jgi:hypothetical protein
LPEGTDTLEYRTVKQTSAKTGAIAMLLAVVFVFAKGADKHNQKDYSLALEVSETQSAEKAHDVSMVKSSDGNMYVISCAEPEQAFDYLMDWFYDASQTPTVERRFERR